MADVRLTATNPEDSSVVAVACDAAGRLLLEEPQVIEGPAGPPGEQGPPGQDGDPFSGNFAGDVTFGGDVTVTSSLRTKTANDSVICNIGSSGTVGPYIAFNAPQALSIYDNPAFDSFTQPHTRYREDGTIFIGGNVIGGVPNIALDGSDGSATFAGYVESTNGNGKAYLGSSTIAGLEITGADTPTKVRLGYDGSAVFAGNKAGFTEEGYLWCTTRRGDTVILDFTSNGAGQWVQYTPTTRIEEIRDKLDANRGDTGEMPADTP